MNLPPAMNAWPDELRLIATLLANALVLAAAWRIARRSNARAAVALPDAILYWLAAQYVIVGVCGLLGVMWPGLFLGVASLLAVAVLVGVGVVDRRRQTASQRPIRDDVASPRRSGSRSEDRIVLVALAFVVAYAGAYLWNQRFVPELGTDPLVYHLPAAGKWLQAGRIELVDFWYWLPANSYSPLGGSLWIAWWLGPIGNDALARFVQLPTWLLLFAASLRLLRDLRVPAAIAALAAIALVVARPFVSQLVIAKDDIAVAALAILLLGAMHPRRLRERAAPARLGVALGLLMSMKYVAALAVPALVPAIVLMRWRTLGAARATAAALVAIAFVGPWLVRNAIVAGNPVWPFFSGDAGFIPDPNLRSLAGIGHMLAGSHHALPIALWAAAIVAWILVIARRGRAIRRDAVLAALVVGPIVAIVTLVSFVPFPEIRYLFTAVSMAMLLVGVACGTLGKRGTLRDRRIGAAFAGIVLAVSIATSFEPSWLPLVAIFAASGAVGAAVAIAFIFANQATRRAALGLAGVVLLLWIYLGWRAYLRHDEAGYARGTNEAYVLTYADTGAMWTTIRDRMPAGSTIAYVNTPTIWPLFGFDLQHRVVFAPSRPGLRHLYDLPPLAERVPARDEYIVATAQLNDGADAATWLANLERLEVDYVYLAKRDSSPNPPELRFVAEHPDRFKTMAENDAAIVWQFAK